MKKIFRVIVNWVRENPPVQPLLFILVIFVGIFALTRVSPFVNWVQAQFQTDTKKAQEIYYDELEEKLDNPNGETFLLVYGAEGCSACDELIEDGLNKFLRSRSKIKTYYYDTFNAMEEDEITEIQLANQLEKITANFANIDYYNEVVDPFDPKTPTLYLFVDGQLERIYVGVLSYSQLKDFTNMDVKFKI